MKPEILILFGSTTGIIILLDHGIVRLQINKFDDYTGTPNALEWLPPAGGKSYNFGVIYLSENPAIGTPYFDRSDAPRGSIAPILPLLLDE